MVIGDEKGSQAWWNANTMYIIRLAYTRGIKRLMRNDFNIAHRHSLLFGYDFQ
jgi:hypothetical protein